VPPPRRRSGSSEVRLRWFGPERRETIGIPTRLPTRTDIYGPEHPTRRLDDLLEAVSFSPRCLDQYRGLSADRLSKGEALAHLRSEARYGELIEEGAYVRLRVRRRFDVMLPEPMPDEGFVVPQLYVPPKARKRAA
jgi:hypothetical protein